MVPPILMLPPPSELISIVVPALRVKVESQSRSRLVFASILIPPADAEISTAVAVLPSLLIETCLVAPVDSIATVPPVDLRPIGKSIIFEQEFQKRGVRH